MLHPGKAPISNLSLRETPLNSLFNVSGRLFKWALWTNNYHCKDHKREGIWYMAGRSVCICLTGLLKLFLARFWTFSARVLGVKKGVGEAPMECQIGE